MTDAWTQGRQALRRQLTDLTVAEVSVVDNPANKLAKIVLFKRDGGQDEEPTAMPEPNTAGYRKYVDDMVAIIKRDPRGAGAALTPSEVMGLHRQHAADIRKDGETVEKARARAWTTPEGQALQAAHRAAQDVAKVSKPPPNAQHGEQNAQMRELHTMATSLREGDPKKYPSDAHARIEARRLRPDLARAERDFNQGLRNPRRVGVA